MYPRNAYEYKIGLSRDSQQLKVDVGMLNTILADVSSVSPSSFAMLVHRQLKDNNNNNEFI